MAPCPQGEVNSLHLVAPEASRSSRFLGGALLQDRAKSARSRLCEGRWRVQWGPDSRVEAVGLCCSFAQNLPSCRIFLQACLSLTPHQAQCPRLVLSALLGNSMLRSDCFISQGFILGFSAIFL